MRIPIDLLICTWILRIAFIFFKVMLISIKGTMNSFSHYFKNYSVVSMLSSMANSVVLLLCFVSTNIFLHSRFKLSIRFEFTYSAFLYPFFVISRILFNLLVDWSRVYCQVFFNNISKCFVGHLTKKKRLCCMEDVKFCNYRFSMNTPFFLL